MILTILVQIRRKKTDEVVETQAVQVDTALPSFYARLEQWQRENRDTSPKLMHEVAIKDAATVLAKCPPDCYATA